MGRKAMILLTDGAGPGQQGVDYQRHRKPPSVPTPPSTPFTLKAKNTTRTRNRGMGGRHGGAFPGGGGGYPGGGGGGYPGGGGAAAGGGQGGGGQEHNQVDGKKILQRMTSETGGRLFEVSKKQTVAEIYQQIAEELHAQYRLGYTPDADHAAEGYHQIDLTLRDTRRSESSRPVTATTPPHNPQLNPAVAHDEAISPGMKTLQSPLD